MSSRASVVIEVDRVSKTYPGSPPVSALREVSLTICEGELVAVVGPSGSGKTTLLHVMGSLDHPSHGTVRITGLDVADLSDRQVAALRATRVGFVFQQFFLAEHASLVDNVADGLLYAGVPARQRRRRAADALTAVGLSDRLHVRPTQISGGQRQRVAIARALVCEPDVLLLDEPFGALDVQTKEDMQLLTRRIWADTGTTIVVVTHDVEEAVFLGQRIVVLGSHPGTVVAEVTVPLGDDRSLETKRSARFLALRAEVEDLVRAHHAVAVSRTDGRVRP